MATTPPFRRLAQPLAQAVADTGRRFDALIIGSGYGGSIAALRLARAGLNVAVLERGREILPGDFPTGFGALRSQMQVKGPGTKLGTETALYDVRLNPDMNVLVACGLGGGSLINGAVALEPDARVFADQAFPPEIARDGLLKEGFAQARAWLKPQSDPRAKEMPKYQALKAGVTAPEQRLVEPELTINFARGLNAANIDQPACTRCGDCCGGCNVGAKTTLTMTYLAAAVDAGARLFTHATVLRIEPGTQPRWSVIVRASDTKTPELALSADIVILGAGALGTTEILLRSKAHGLALSDQLGHRFSANGDVIAFGYGTKQPVGAVGVGHPSKIEGRIVGAAVSGQVEIDDARNFENTVTIQEGVLPSSLAPLLPALFIPNGRILGALKALILGVYEGPFQNLQTFFAVSHDDAAGSLKLTDDRLDVIWPGAKDHPIYARLDALLSGLTSGVGGAYVRNPLANLMRSDVPGTAHPLGGAGMARDATTGVVNHKGQVFNPEAHVHDGLYVLDGAQVPRSLGVNPLLTISALAERALALMAVELGLRSGA